MSDQIERIYWIMIYKHKPKGFFAIILALIAAFILIVPIYATMAPGVAGGGDMGVPRYAGGRLGEPFEPENGIVSDDGDGVPGDPENGIIDGGFGSSEAPDSSTSAPESTTIGGMSDDTAGGTTGGTSSVTSADSTTSAQNDSDSSSGVMGNVWGIIIAILIIAAIVLLIFALIPKK